MRLLSILACAALAPAASFLLPASLNRPCQHAVQHQLVNKGRMAMVEDNDTDELEAAIDALVRAEVEAAFSGLQKTLDADDEEALKMIEQKGKEVMQKVLAKLDEDGKLLTSSLGKEVEELAMAKQKQLLEDYDASTAELKRQMLEQRQSIREDMERLSSLSKDYNELKGSSGGIDKDTLIGGASFLVGLTYTSAALNEALKLAFGGGDDGSVLTILLNAALGTVGIGYYFSRKGQQK